MPRIKKTSIKQIKEDKLITDIYNTHAEIIGKINLPEEIFKAKINPVLMTQAVRVYLANQRLGTHSSKTRAVVSGSTRKIYRQKGTGRARHGDIKAPIFIGGGIAHGPKPKDYSLLLPQRMKKQALFSSLTDKFQEGRIKIISGLETIEPKTKKMVKVLNNLYFASDRKKPQKVLLVLPEKQENVFLAGRNLNYLQISQAKLLNTYEVLNNQNLLFTKEAIQILEKNFLKKDGDTGTKVVADKLKKDLSYKLSRKKKQLKKSPIRKKSKILIKSVKTKKSRKKQ